MTGNLFQREYLLHVQTNFISIRFVTGDRY